MFFILNTTNEQNKTAEIKGKPPSPKTVGMFLKADMEGKLTQNDENRGHNRAFFSFGIIEN